MDLGNLGQIWVHILRTCGVMNCLNFNRLREPHSFLNYLKLLVAIYVSMVRIILFLQIFKLPCRGVPPCHRLEGRDASTSQISAAKIATIGERARSASQGLFR